MSILCHVHTAYIQGAMWMMVGQDAQPSPMHLPSPYTCSHLEMLSKHTPPLKATATRIGETRI